MGVSILVMLWGVYTCGVTALGPRRAFSLPLLMLVGPLAVAAVLAGVSPRLCAVLLLGAIAGVHAGWTCGMTWPAPSVRAMPAYLIGWPEGDRKPATGPTLLVALVVAALAAGLWLELPYVRWVVVAIFVGRGLYGFVEERIFRPRIADTPYATLSPLFYSPLCLFIGALAAAR